VSSSSGGVSSEKLNCICGGFFDIYDIIDLFSKKD